MGDHSLRSTAAFYCKIRVKALHSRSVFKAYSLPLPGGTRTSQGCSVGLPRCVPRWNEDTHNPAKITHSTVALNTTVNIHAGRSAAVSKQVWKWLLMILETIWCTGSHSSGSDGQCCLYLERLVFHSPMKIRKIWYGPCTTIVFGVGHGSLEDITSK